MARKPNILPSYLLHKPTGQARIRIDGKIITSVSLDRRNPESLTVNLSLHMLAGYQLIRLHCPNVVVTRLLPQLKLTIPGRQLANSA